jgi:hypothetical protein
MATPDASSLGFELIPADDPIIPPDEAIRRAIASREPVASQVQETREPYGMSWGFNFDTGQFIMNGSLPAEVNGLDSLRQWCIAALNTHRSAHLAAGPEFGMERPEEPLGHVYPEMVLADYERHVVEALVQHDRIASVENVTASFDPTTGIVSLRFTVVTDTAEDVLDVPGMSVSVRRIETLGSDDDDGSMI